MRWLNLQSQLELAPSDVLILLDCCHSGGSVHASPSTSLTPGRTNPNSRINQSSSKPGTTELIAASAFDSFTPGPSHLSFTAALVAELVQFAEKRELFSAAELHRRILERIIKRSAGLILKPWEYPTASPVYVRLVGDVDAPSIGLRRLPFVSDLYGEVFRGNRATGEIKGKTRSPEVSGWREGRRGWLTTAQMDSWDVSPVTLLPRQGRGGGVLWRTGKRLRDLVLRVPKQDP
jgi:hypothetical protein